MEQIIPIILGVSLANERLLEILKTQIPWLSNQFESLAEKQKVTKNEKGRKIVIQLITISTGWLTASFFADAGEAIEGEAISLGFFKNLFFGSINEIPVFLIGVLASAGSAFWNQVFSYTKAVKDIRKQAATSENIKLQLENRRSNYSSASAELSTTHPKF